ncbi:hypothetical protein Bca4012_059268 [Brassica carinata]
MAPTLTSAHHFPSRFHSIQFPFFLGASSPTITHRATNLRPISAVEAPEKIEKIGSEISSLTLEEARILVDYLQDKFGVSPLSLAPAAAVAAAPGDGGGARLRWRSDGVRRGDQRGAQQRAYRGDQSG